MTNKQLETMIEGILGFLQHKEYCQSVTRLYRHNDEPVPCNCGLDMLLKRWYAEQFDE